MIPVLCRPGFDEDIAARGDGWMLKAVLAHRLGRGLRLRPDAAAAGLIPVPAEFLFPVAVQVVGQRLIIPAVVDFVSILVHVIVVFPQMPNLDHAAEAPDPADLILRNAVRDHVQMDPARRLALPVDNHDLDVWVLI